MSGLSNTWGRRGETQGNAPAHKRIWNVEMGVTAQMDIFSLSLSEKPNWNIIELKAELGEYYRNKDPCQLNQAGQSLEEN